MTLTIALAQINPTVGDLDGNVRKIVEGMARARELGCRLVAFPELAIPGYPPEDLLFKRAFIEANLRALDEVTCASRSLTAVVGFIDKRDDIFNAAAVLHKMVSVSSAPSPSARTVSTGWKSPSSNG